MGSFDLLTRFYDESEKLGNLIHNASAKPILSLSEIVETYYHVMNVSSMVTILKQLDFNNDKALEKINKTETMISGTFDSEIHPKVSIYLTNSIQNIMKDLQSKNSEKKSKQDIENEAKQYEELRQMMSTREFVEQYGKSISG
ncbi:MAG: hypothetical protein K5793_00470 [Nitrosarchaeum sp.]|nr:hypothetical protein [Nitrosarchaeum sp.]MCV0399208.1 hypothetical protein [Nitrosarchaeum sp.]